MSARPYVERAATLLLAHETDLRRRAYTFNDPNNPPYELSPGEATHAIQYLETYGYLPQLLARWTDITIGDILDALQTFQSWFGLVKTNTVSPQTVRAMLAPRCGHPDIVRDYHAEELRVQFVAEQNLAAWAKRGLLYGVQSYVSGIDQATQDAILQKAFDNWTQHCNLSIRRAGPGEAVDIVIGTGQGPASNFDGPGGVLAWAYLPNGQDQQLTMRFDLAETWITDPAKRGILMLNVACHEFGHLLGCSHSQVQAALMAPYYAVNVATPQPNDDIPRIQARYGVRNLPVPPVPLPPPPTIPAPTPTINSLNISWTGVAQVVLNGKQIL